MPVGSLFLICGRKGLAGRSFRDRLRLWLTAILAGGTAVSLLALTAPLRLRVCGIVRDWLPAPLLLVAYWAVDWPSGTGYRLDLERRWVQLDKALLIGWSGKAAVESLGWMLPFLLELCYSLLYAIPPVSIGVLYLYRRRDRVDRFLFTLLLGALTTYALLPLFPSRSPRIAFPGEDLRAFNTPSAYLNVWLLDHCDIQAVSSPAVMSQSVSRRPSPCFWPSPSGGVWRLQSPPWLARWRWLRFMAGITTPWMGSRPSP